MKKILIAVLTVTVLFCSVVTFSACGGTNSATDPEARGDVAASAKAFTLDLNSSSPKRNLAMPTYFDDKEQENVEYAYELTGDAVTAAWGSARLEITAVKKGAASVKLLAKVSGEVKATFDDIKFTVVNTTPFAVTPPTGEQFTFAGEATAKPDTAYVFTITPTDEYLASGTVSAKYKIGAGEEKSVNGTLKDASKQTYEFTVPASDVTDAITVVSVNGISKNTADSSSVTLITDNGEFVMTGAAKAYINRDYQFTLATGSYYDVPKATYKVGGGAAKEITATGTPNASAVTTEYTFTVPQADLKKDQTLVITAVALKLKQASSLAGGYFTAAGWGAVPGVTERLVAPEAVTDGGRDALKFTDTTVKMAGGISGANLSTVTTETYAQQSFMVKTDNSLDMLFFCSSNTRAYTSETAPEASGAPAPGSAATWGGEDNWLRLITDASGNISFTIGRAHVMQADDQGGAANPVLGVRDVPAAVSTNVKYSVGAWARVDIVYYGVDKDYFAGNTFGQRATIIKVFVNGVQIKMGATATAHEMVHIDTDGNLNIQVGGPTYGAGCAIWAKGTTYIAPVGSAD